MSCGYATGHLGVSCDLARAFDPRVREIVSRFSRSQVERCERETRRKGRSIRVTGRKRERGKVMTRRHGFRRGTEEWCKDEGPFALDVKQGALNQAFACDGKFLASE